MDPNVIEAKVVVSGTGHGKISAHAFCIIWKWLILIFYFRWTHGCFWC
jgi:hypothetical protein